MLKKLISVLFLCTTVLLVACSKPIAADKQNYIGQWQSADGRINMEITAEGRLEYSNQQPGKSSSISAPISEFKGDSFSAGLGPLSSDFIVSQAPKQIADGTWSMTVDNHELNRIR